jgi:hypothetical protein
MDIDAVNLMIQRRRKASIEPAAHQFTSKYELRHAHPCISLTSTFYDPGGHIPSDRLFD